MSQAFDIVRESELFNILEDVLEKDELHMLKILVEDVSLRVRIGKSIGNEINTNIVVPQGDCLSSIVSIHRISNRGSQTNQIDRHTVLC